MNTRGLVYIGTTPSEEPCAATGSKKYDWAHVQKIECRAYIAALKRVFGEPPEGVRLFVASMAHDFGSYYEVQCGYDSTIQEQLDYALKVEDGLSFWEDAKMWAPVLYHPDDDTPIDMLPPERWEQKEDQEFRPRGVPL